MASLLEVPLAVSTPSNNFPRSRFSLISFNSNVLIGQVCLLGSQVMNDVGAFTPPQPPPSPSHSGMLLASAV